MVMDENQLITIVVDHRERGSGILQSLVDNGVTAKEETLKSGDYLINNEVLLERKTKDDFSQSLIQNRLFVQCANMKRTIYRPVFLIEGNPYTTSHKVSREAIKGALLSVSVTWHIPIIYSSGCEETVQLLIQVAMQNLKGKVNYPRSGYKPKTLSKQYLYFIQGIPSVGPQMAQRLIEYFATLPRLVSATVDELQNVPGIGKQKALQIEEFLNGPRFNSK